MKQTIDGILVVEGKSDVAYLSNYFDCEFVTTNGSDVPESTIEYLKSLKEKGQNIIVLTDPDFPGKKIRDVLDEKIPGLKHCFVEKSHSIKNGKVGVAECDIDEIKRAISSTFENKKTTKEYITTSDLYALGLSGQVNSNILRNKLSKKLNIGYVNSKTLLKRLNALEIDRTKVEALLNEWFRILWKS